jgi:hypothetical protein
MAVERPASESTEVTPNEGEPVEATDTAVPADDPTVAAPASPVVPSDDVLEEPIPADSTSEPIVATTDPAAVQIAAPVQQIVYVEAPKPFVKKGNRGFGVVIALLATVAFALLYALAVVIAETVSVGSTDSSFLGTADFWAPVALFAIGFIILVLILNRAAWVAHVFGSIFVGLFVYFGSAGAEIVIHASTIPSNEVGLFYSHALFSVGAIVAALLAREVALWMGIAISARGRRVKARNIEARKLYDEEIEAKRAEYQTGQSPVVS